MLWRPNSKYLLSSFLTTTISSPTILLATDWYIEKSENIARKDRLPIYGLKNLIVALRTYRKKWVTFFSCIACMLILSLLYELTKSVNTMCVFRLTCFIISKLHIFRKYCSVICLDKKSGGPPVFGSPSCRNWKFRNRNLLWNAYINFNSVTMAVFFIRKQYYCMLWLCCMILILPHISFPTLQMIP